MNGKNTQSKNFVVVFAVFERRFFLYTTLFNLGGIMKNKEYEFYESGKNWDFSMIKCRVEKLTNWNLYEKIKENTNEKSLCLDLGTGGGEKVLKK